MLPTLLVILIIAVVLLLFWLSQMVALMNMKDDEFPGGHDKILWFIAILIGSFAGALAFLLWRTVRSGEAFSERLASEIGALIKRRPEQGKADKNHRRLF